MSINKYLSLFTLSILLIMYNIPNMQNLPNLFNLPNIFNMPNMANMPNMQNRDNLYSILNVSNNASADEIKKSYRKLSLEYHPDRNGGDREKSEKYKKITEAYKILGDETERKKYDLSFNLNLETMDIDPSMFMNILLNPNIANNIIDEIANMGLSNMGFANLPGTGNNRQFNGSINRGFSQHQYSSKPATIHRVVKINILEAYKGCKIPIAITRWIIESDIKSEQTETIYIDINKGIDDNEIITIPYKGNRVSDTNRGDIEIKVEITNNTLFERHGIDLILNKSITLKESFCGFSFDLTYIDGREFKINNEAGNIIPANFRKIIPNFGMKRDNDTGNLIIIFDIIYPKQFTLEQIEQLNKIL